MGAIFSLISGHFDIWFLIVPTGFLSFLQLNVLKGLYYEYLWKCIENYWFNKYQSILFCKYLRNESWDFYKKWNLSLYDCKGLPIFFWLKSVHKFARTRQAVTIPVNVATLMTENLRWIIENVTWYLCIHQNIYQYCFLSITM